MRTMATVRVLLGLFVSVLLSVLLSGCGAGAPPYAECVDDLDCEAPSMACYQVRLTRSDGSEGDGAFCSADCQTDADCPEDGVCLALEGDPSGRLFCVDRCRGSADCYTPFACTMVEGDASSMQVCLP